MINVEELAINNNNIVHMICVCVLLIIPHFIKRLESVIFLSAGWKEQYNAGYCTRYDYNYTIDGLSKIFNHVISVTKNTKVRQCFIPDCLTDLLVKKHLVLLAQFLYLEQLKI